MPDRSSINPVCNPVCYFRLLFFFFHFFLHIFPCNHDVVLPECVLIYETVLIGTTTGFHEELEGENPMSQVLYFLEKVLSCLEYASFTHAK